MSVNWPLVVVLFGLATPGVVIAMPRLIYFLLPNNTEELKKRFSRFAVIQTLLMVLVTSFAGSFLSMNTGLDDSLLTGLLVGKTEWPTFLSILWPTLFYSGLCLIVFLVLYYGVVKATLDAVSFGVMARLRSVMRVDGCVLYGGVAEEVLARWGLMNLIAFFAILLSGQNNSAVMTTAIIISGLMFAIAQIPAYIAAGCVPSRRLLYSIVLLSFWQSLIFGFLFWHYGLVSAILAHMLFHFGWWAYDKT